MVWRVEGGGETRRHLERRGGRGVWGQVNGENAKRDVACEDDVGPEHRAEGTQEPPRLEPSRPYPTGPHRRLPALHPVTPLHPARDRMPDAGRRNWKALSFS